MELINLLPSYYENNTTMKTLQEILSQETDQLDDSMYTTVNECFPQTSSALLSRYEKILGIDTDISKSNRFRRERIAAKMSGAGTTSKSLVESIASSYTNAEVEVLETFGEYLVTIKFVGTIGIPGNIADIKQSIEEAIPAHLRVEYEYVYNTYGSVSTLTHAELSEYTHYEIRNGRARSSSQKLQKYQHIELAQLTHVQLTKGELPNGN